ncbi:hypothetical protein CWE09_02060 [Aliidiomarina minuta]|uniref:Uncharacterized protein n=1 Tax=Aliidiomarina minuta TaxID=880057 RepID=A0A432W642_9GAMM|nr:hypothetical protein [Aliidiomarina minuta]RUO25543.1 hypothetical protein CWE09_02060 [Aliidiomarina minuta]
MKSSVSLFWLAILVVLVSQFNFLLNAQVLYGAYLTLSGVLLGLVLGFGLYLFKKHKNQQSMYVLEEDGRRDPWYKQVFQTEWVFTLSIVLGMIATSMLNNKLVVFDVYEQNFQVIGQGEHFYRASQYQYIVLEQGSAQVKYLSDQNIAVGESVTATLRRGPLGFPVLLSVQPEAAN